MSGKGRLTMDQMEELVPSSFREMYPGDSRLVTEDGEPISQALVEWSYTREGRHQVGVEFPNPIPVEAPLQGQPHEPIWEMIKRMVLDHARREKEGTEEEEFETEEEANDFDTGDDYDPQSPWEEHHEPQDPWPMSSAARQLEQAIAEKRNAGRIAVLQEELEALQQGKEWPPAPPPAPAASPPGPTGGTNPASS